jgi:hypothetical protein
MTTSALVRIDATADHVAKVNVRPARAGDLPPIRAVVVHCDDGSGPRSESFRPRRSLASGEHGVDTFPITLVLSSRGPSVEHGSRRCKSTKADRNGRVVISRRR